ncbi:UDP-glucuronosyl/UDP-glucosyltransferase [Artemisia annua]|uniref:UDP-glucuronosyl/UDP-glucosyltransferase n=1 Tax=Artemisia annua TaxID=35608 RepID=A0A2U1N888_ARTAN|nr:UDP-glucuronosyl/UDP-glucosyltransferase [Artemisia annua]
MPGLPDQIEVTKPQASTWGKGDSKETTEMFDRLLEAEKTSSGIVVNSFEELEPKYVEAFARAKDKVVWCIGPVSLSNKSFEDLSERGNKPAINKDDCLKWLDSREQGSVVYVCLGSLWYGSTEQAIELGLGLESSNKPFIWFIRQTSDEFERWLLEEGYEERIKDRGLMVRGWAPQILILSHEAIGGFITHCGWNSTLEGICAGIPMVTWPHFADQFLNERFIVDVLKIGVKIGILSRCTEQTSENSMASPHHTDLHFVLFPLMAQGHLIPMVDMARILAQRGAIVTIVTSPVNAKRFKPVIDRAIEAKLQIQFLELPLPLDEVGLPEGCENFDLLPSHAHALNMYSAMSMLENPAEILLKTLCTPPSCIISES